MKSVSRKRIYYNLGSFLQDFLSFTVNSFAYVKHIGSPCVSNALREKLMVAVSGVLACKYCTWLHSEMALTHGVDTDEIRKLLSLEVGEFPEDEAIALAYAQHYSETGGHPREQATARLVYYYGRRKANAILCYLQIIYFGNLSGNTVDAFLERLKGTPVDESGLGNEIILFLFLGPYYLVILPLLARMLRHLNRRRPVCADTPFGKSASADEVTP